MQDPTWPSSRFEPGQRHRWHQHRRGPLRRDTGDRLVGGVAAGIASARGSSVTRIRIIFAVLALVSYGFLVPAYFLAWLLVPAAGSDSSIGSKARGDSRGITLAAGLVSVVVLLMLLGGILGWAWPQVLSVGCLVLIWRNAEPDERAAMRRLVEPLEGAGAGGTSPRSGPVLRITIAGIMLIGGLGWLASAHENIAVLRQLGGVLLVIAAIVVLLGPWWLRIARDLALERQARVRVEERSEMAARLHDSVLQTLALIQRRADDPHQVVQLARSQERELRSWLFEGRAPGSAGDEAETFAAGVRLIQQEIEARYGVPVEAVTVGDCPLDESLSAVLAAAREATVNAAKWSGADVISLFAEVEPSSVSLVVRDRGRGFDPGAVPADRKGLAESVRGRMSRRGGSATITSAVGEGAKVTLTMPRAGAQPQASRA